SWPTAVETWLGTGIEHDYIDPNGIKAGKPWPIAVPAPDGADFGLPAEVSCHTSLYFVAPEPEKCAACRKAACADKDEKEELEKACTCPKPGEKKELYPWRTVYERDGKPVVIERSIGKGTIALSALSYFVSNEAMRDERHPELLLWLVDDAKHVIFDEHHHGITRQRGIATLARKYRLHWLGVGFILLAGLFVWKNSVSLVPADSTMHGTLGGPVAEGKDSASGLVNLLRRNIGSGRVLRTCLDEHESSTGRADSMTRRKLERIARLLEEEEKRPARRRDNAKTYNEICRILNEK
ncbi:hypothetical protein ACFLQU_02430, partial [Verrucomicrobiota bacterium]